MKPYALAFGLALVALPAGSEQVLRGTANGTVDDQIRVDGYLYIKGVVNSDVIVPPDAEVRCSGVVIGNVIVGARARAVIAGVVNGTIENQGGNIEISGVVGSIKNQNGRAKTIVRAGSIVAGKKLASDTSDF